jgi:hypothetical protein
LGIINLCVSNQHKQEIVSVNAPEPLRKIADGHLDVECQRLAFLAIARLTSTEEAQSLILQEGILNIVISLSTQSLDFAVRNYSAVNLSYLAQNLHTGKCLISDGGLEGIYLLARNTSLAEIQREVLTAITS